ncbi:WhiB family transcriptional regulator [Streptomyces sp. NPDC047315]|uniref:WhiB family transcriptional regulator n=1 Tax=Streptomyces sp. NPDC047315 TaxID=3155142 RepID=UPI003401EB1E
MSRRNLEWMDEAVCATVDPDLWFPELGSSHKPARSICATCPVQAECAAAAQRFEGGLGAGVRHGTWGGQTHRTRAKIAKRAAA